MKLMKINILTLIAFVALTMTFTSCEDDPIRGCTDPEAENYDALSVEDDGNCTFTRDKFLGSYLGNLACPGALAPISNDAFAFTISESVSGGINEVGVLLENLGVTINGTVNGSVISLNSVVPGYPFDANGDGVPDLNADLEVTGSATLSADETTMTGQLDIVAKSSDSGATLGTDSCSMDGVKQ